MTYTEVKHLHNFGVWAASRASQRGFTTTRIIKKAITESSLPNFSIKEIYQIKSQKDFDQVHRRICNELIDEFGKMEISKPTFGRAAKIVSIYLKVVVVLPRLGQTHNINYIHPPIDRILLKNLNSKFKLFKVLPSWTKLSEKEYYSVWNKIRPIGNDKAWQIEEYWEA